MKYLKLRYIPAFALAAVLLTPLGVFADETEEYPVFSNNSVIVTLKPKNAEFGLMSVDSASDDIFEGLGVTEVENIDKPPARELSLFSVDNEEQTLVLTLDTEDEENVLRVIDELKKHNEVKRVQPNFYYYLDDTSSPEDEPRYNTQYYLKIVDAPNVWKMGISAQNVVVAVLDSGARWTHEDLFYNLWVNEAEYYGGEGVDDDGNGYIDDVYGYNVMGDTTLLDYSGHGTHVAGIVSAVSNNKNGIASLAKDARVMIIKLFDPQVTNSANVVTHEGKATTTAMIHKALKYVKKMNPQVANCSWGATSYATLRDNETARDEDMKLLIGECTDTVFTASAGNYVAGKNTVESRNNDKYPMYPASFDLDNVISVGATTKNDALGSYSHYGATSVDIAAPGSAINSLSITNDYNYEEKTGTSMAAPLVASAVAVVRARFPEMSADEAVQCIYDGADKLTSLNTLVNNSRRLNAYKSLMLYATPIPTEVPSPSPTATALPSPSPTATALPSPSPTATALPSPSPTATALPTTTPIPTSTAKPTSAPTQTPKSAVSEPTETPKSATPKPTASPSASALPTPTGGVSPIASPTKNPTTPTPTITPTVTPTVIPAVTPTATPMPTDNPTAAPTPQTGLEPTPTASSGEIPSLPPTPEPTPALSPAPTPLPTEIPFPDATGASIEKVGDNYRIRVQFGADEEPDTEALRVFAVYKRDGLLAHIDIIELNEDLTSDFALAEGYDASELQVYIWSGIMNPVCKPVTIEDSLQEE